MIAYIVPTNIDDRVLVRAARLLEEGNLIAVPSDTSWVVVCSMNSHKGIDRLRKISGERDERHFTLLCSDISQFAELCSMDNTRFRLIKRLSPGPYVFILKTLLGTEKALNLRRGEIGVRIPDHPVPVDLIKTLGSPLYSVTAKKSMAGTGFRDRETPAPEAGDKLPPIPEEDLFTGGWELEEIEGLALILDTGDERPRIFSTILDVSGNEVLPIRLGAGLWPV
ncbi:MAG: L-threonylcarbamoyladenylate synthase [Spirochaetaceae bacterium]|jgi:tRNA threonylcarbamoyl adenosine modification protein (Sua5/YciO/YrdC/YwlC family)|nr:L-threonylcarbamoyladenylate synthase [Spirochaetaceae bacterium]